MDPRLRELERQARTGNLEARVAWLQARLRSGDLDVKRLEVAAACGDPGARRLVHKTRWWLGLKMRDWQCFSCMFNRTVTFDMFEPYQCISCGVSRTLKANIEATRAWLVMLRDWGHDTRQRGCLLPGLRDAVRHSRSPASGVRSLQRSATEVRLQGSNPGTNQSSTW